MNKTVWAGAVLLLLVATVSFAADAPNGHIFIEGTAVSEEYRTYFMENLTMEGKASRYTIAKEKEGAGYTLRFDVVQNMIDGTQQVDEELPYALILTLIRNTDDVELVSFSFLFTTLNEMYSYNQYLFLKAAVNLPPEFIPLATLGKGADWQVFPYSLGLSAEVGLNSRDRVTVGYGAALERYLFTPYLMAGLRFMRFNDFNTISSTELRINLRAYFIREGGPFLQFGFGMGFYTEEERNITTYVPDITLGYRLYLKKGVLRGFYVEPFLRAGFPFQASGGLMIGHWFNF